MDLPYRQRSLQEVKAYRDALSDLAEFYTNNPSARLEGGVPARHEVITALEAATDVFDMLVEQVENQVIIF